MGKWGKGKEEEDSEIFFAFSPFPLLPFSPAAF
jgi:hypothetical protein